MLLINSAWPSFVGGHNKYQPEGGDALWPRSKADVVCVWVAGKTVRSLVTHGPYLSALEMKGLCIKCYIIQLFTLLLLYFTFIIVGR